MKKFMKALAVFAAMAMLAGSFVSCSSDDDSSDSKPAATKYKCDGCGTEYDTEEEKKACAKQEGCPKYVAVAPAITLTGNETVEIGSTITLTSSEADVTWTSSDNTKATVENGVVTGVAVGSVTITAKKDGFTSGTKTISVIVPSFAGDITKAFTFDLASYSVSDLENLGSTISGEPQFYSDSKGKAKNSLKIKTINPAISLSNGLIVFNTADNQIQVRTESTTDATTKGINYGGQSVGDKTNNGTCPDVGQTVTLSDTVKVSRYIAFPVASGNESDKFKVNVTYKTTNDAGVIMALVDQNNVVLAKTPEDKSKEVAHLEETISRGSITEVRLYLFRTGNAGSGGADVTSIALTPVVE